MDEKFKSFFETRKVTFVISAIYVGAGTLAVCSISGGDLLYGEWSFYVLLITFPVTVVSLIYRFCESDYMLLFC